MSSSDGTGSSVLLAGADQFDAREFGAHVKRVDTARCRRWPEICLNGWMECVHGREVVQVPSVATIMALVLKSPVMKPVIHLVPMVLVIGYPWLLKAFHLAVTRETYLLAVLFLIMAFAVPAFCGLFAWRLARQERPTERHTRVQRLDYLGVTTPTIFVFLGVVQSLVKSPFPDEMVWAVGWTVLGIWAWSGSNLRQPHQGPRDVTRWRVPHGIIAAMILTYVLIHIGNHVFGLVGPDAHRAIMKAGRYVYRAQMVEPILVVLFVVQVVIGLRLAWRWSASNADFHRVFQVASGLYLSVFILGHMNSVFIYARSVKKIPTDWNFAIGAPAGLIHDAWNIRLLPRYALGVFFVLAHLTSGLRVVLLAHRVHGRVVDIMWKAGVFLSAAISAAIIAGMCGARI